MKQKDIKKIGNFVNDEWNRITPCFSNEIDVELDEIANDPEINLPSQFDSRKKSLFNVLSKAFELIQHGEHDGEAIINIIQAMMLLARREAEVDTAGTTFDYIKKMISLPEVTTRKTTNGASLGGLYFPTEQNNLKLIPYVKHMLKEKTDIVNAINVVRTENAVSAAASAEREEKILRHAEKIPVMVHAQQTKEGRSILKCDAILTAINATDEERAVFVAWFNNNGEKRSQSEVARMTKLSQSQVRRRAESFNRKAKENNSIKIFWQYTPKRDNSFLARKTVGIEDKKR